MNNFTSFKNFSAINEAKHTNVVVLSSDDIKKYLEAVKKLIPTQVADIIYLTAVYDLNSQKDIEDIRNANKGQLNKIAFKYGMSQDNIEDLWKGLKELKSNLRLLPQYQTTSERNAFMSGKLKMSDITIDLETSSGRNACAKLYMPMVNKIVGDYIGKSNLEKPELMSAALQGFTDAMNDWRKNGAEENNVPFKTYAAYRVKQQILHDIKELSYTVKTNWYAVQKMGAGALSAVSIDSPITNDSDDDFKQDRLKSLSTEDPNYNLTKSEEDNWNTLYKLIEDKFKQRDVDIFYRHFGLKGYQKEKGKDIAKSLGISSSYVTGIVNMILRFLKKDNKAMDILSDIQMSYNESLMFDVMNLSKDMIVETILADNTFILLEELTKWSNKNIYIKSLEDALNGLGSEADIILSILQNNFEYLDKNFKSEKTTIVKFLGMMYPTESFKRKTDVAILEYMTELSELYKKYYK